MPNSYYSRIAAFQREWKQSVIVRTPLALSIAAGGRSRGADAFGILMYHRVTDAVRGYPFPTLNVTPQRFRSQLQGLLDRGHQAWPLRRALDAHTAGEAIPRNVFVVTFDDGYANNFTQAFPILRELGIPATIFIATAYLDTNEPFPFEDWTPAGLDGVPADSWRPLTTDECHAMLDSGIIELGAHTHTHTPYRHQPDPFREDLEKSMRILCERFGYHDLTFAFPFGKRHHGLAGPTMYPAARQAGVLCALTTENELVCPDSNPYDWGRFTVCQGDTGATISAKLNGWYSFIRDGWRGIRRRTRAIGTKTT
ncbi:polysaccharide deacetylase family protein [Novipirellula caenicola]|uniref:polysaccharide deacetylase family protein n=1 Tax=Novipirellula caenicola TaxID=1536901 RepID=UPI0031E844C9